MSFQLRPYQQEAAARALEFLRTPTPKRKQPKHGVVIAPTGSGKSLIIANIVMGLDGPCLVFQPRKEILEQNYSKFVAYGYQPAVYSASMRKRQIGDITLATIGSVRKNPGLFQDVKYVIVDECHLVSSKSGMYADFFKALGDIRILGLTATPYRLSVDGYGGAMLRFITRTRPKIFSEVVYYIQNRELFEAGYLAKLKYFKVKGLDRSHLKLNTIGTEYDPRSVQMHFKEIGFENKLVRVIKRLLEIGRHGVLVFTAFVEESQALCQQVPGATMVTADTPSAERRKVIEDFKAGRTKVVCNVGILGIGFDYPELDSIVLARPTMSLAVYYQQVGRGIRPHPDKDHTMIVDMVCLEDEFGKIEDLNISFQPGKREKKWVVASGHRPLTNVYFGDPPQIRRPSRPLMEEG